MTGAILFSMSSSFLKNGECESHQFKGKGLGAHLVNHPMSCEIPAQPGLVLLAAEPTEDVHHGAFAGFFKGAQGDVLSLGEQGFGFSHFSFFVELRSDSSVAGPARNRTQALLQKVVSQ